VFTTQQMELPMNGQISSLIASQQAADLQREARGARLARKSRPERARWAQPRPTRNDPNAREEQTP
jgi:hypothetical protein